MAFFLREVVGCPEETALPRAKGRKSLPAVLSMEECRRVIAEPMGRDHLVVSLLYGSGLRLAEALNLRVKDVCFDPYRLTVKDGKGAKDRETPLPERAANALRRQIELVTRMHEVDLEKAHGWARLPGALDRKAPGSGYELAWQFVFPSPSLSRDPATGRMGRHHLHPSVPQHASCHTFRHSFASHALRMGMDVRLVEELMGHTDLKTTQVYLHVQNRAGYGIRSPLDWLMDD